ncbi:uncharacterized protein LOC134535365, partial [Bacillus rossius redtenbacheri]|uniref:uncharacterized protein LOC134535365 n=1 Tax=Bacillus rossius redtenbacheri TaxID=93214 RepID=UPI002FDD2D4A
WRVAARRSASWRLCASSWWGAGGQSANDVENPTTKKTASKLTCPPGNVRAPFLSLQCRADDDCTVLNQLCCDKRCRKGVPPPTPQPTHRPLLGVFPRECSREPLVEPLGIKNCTEDTDCWPRICCPEGGTGYCRTPPPTFRNAPNLTTLKTAVAYLQCTQPPPPIFDLFPRTCRNSLDCFPNLCCQERGKKVCRPPKRSLLAVLGRLTRVQPDTYSQR